MTAVTWGLSNFIFGFLNAHDFATVCLNYSGNFIVSLGCKGYFMYFEKKDDKQSMLKKFFFQAIMKEDGKISVPLAFHSFVRGFLFLMNNFLTLGAAYYSRQARLNFGVISTIFCLSTVFTTVLS